MLIIATFGFFQNVSPFLLSTCWEPMLLLQLIGWRLSSLTCPKNQETSHSTSWWVFFFQKPSTWNSEKFIWIAIVNACLLQGSKKSFEISPAPKGLESAITLLFTEDCLEFLVKLVETFDQKADEVRILETAIALWNVYTHTHKRGSAANSSDFLRRRV